MMKYSLLAALLWTSGFASVAHAQDKSVFEGPMAPMEERLAPAPSGGEALRTLVVEERVGSARHGELVRVPLFFHAGECPDVNGFALVEEGAPQRAIPYQVDDVRRDVSGQISRMHLYFETDLKPWQRKKYVLKRGNNPVAASMPAKVEGDTVTLGSEDLKLTFRTSGASAGSIVGIKTTAGKVRLGPAGLAPRLTLVRQSADLKVVRSSTLRYADPSSFELRNLRWAAGPLFSKLIVRIGPPGLPDNAEFAYFIPRSGTEFYQQEVLSPTNANDTDVVGAKEHVLLTGNLVLGAPGAAPEVLHIPAGLRRWTRAVLGDTNDALVDKADGISLLAIPAVQTGLDGMTFDHGDLSVRGTKNFVRTANAASSSLRQFWGQTRYIFTHTTDQEGLWELSKINFQPLTAVVDEPGLTSAILHREVAAIMPQFGRLAWGQEAAKLFVAQKEGELNKLLEVTPPVEEVQLLAKAADARKQLIAANHGGPIREDQVTKAAGPLDSYMITQTMSPYAFLANAGYAPKKLTADALSVARASQAVNGLVSKYGFPYINEFFTALNMQGGSVILGLYAAKQTGDLQLAQYYRDVARSPAILDIYGHGQRSYSGNGAAGNSDMLYECLADFWFRNASLVSGADLWQHPTVYARFFDAIDVNADLYDRPVTAPQKVEYPASGRANVFRTQTHDHRWAYWIAAPYLGLAAHPADGGRVGITEATYWARRSQGGYVNWPDATILFLADIDQRELIRKYTPEPSPALPGNIRVVPGSNGNTVSWEAAPGAKALGYRIYRADFVGGPLTFVNSPYWPTPGKLATGTSYVDADGHPGQVYLVTAVDEQLRESRWFADEPQP